MPHGLQNDNGYFISNNVEPINRETLDIFIGWLRGYCPPEKVESRARTLPMRK
ncbi:hypothetical protein BX592_12429 [Paraburkholderia rhizosphaerae]|uniref:Uncharacterized protein n=1 Tax=Paraburkholderia rhizosphaerae TaxID=480658 RepID=A0A4R8LC30_9BURK|nr:hypothetical protein BX592_12429 [Paraburkholderia rhizosphaerae]